MSYFPSKLQEAVEGMKAMNNFIPKGRKLLLKPHMLHPGFHAIRQSLAGKVHLPLGPSSNYTPLNQVADRTV